MDAYSWYDSLLKPSWEPVAEVFQPVWIILYVIIFISFGAVFYDLYEKKLPKYIAWPFALNLLFNFLFTPLQFGLRNNVLASIDIILILATLTWGFMAIGQDKRWVVYVNIPYFLWVMFATTLQISITILNI
jgi:tryptophan-rich sensory protein